MSTAKWYGKVIFQNEGVYTYHECDTQAEAQAFVDGFKAAKDITKDDAIDDFDSLEDYWTCVDQVKPRDV